MSAITESKGLELALSLRILLVEISKQRPKMTVICIVFPMIKVLNSHLMCHGTIWTNFKQNRIPHAISSLQQFAKVQR